MSRWVVTCPAVLVPSAPVRRRFAHGLFVLPMVLGLGAAFAADDAVVDRARRGPPVADEADEEMFVEEEVFAEEPEEPDVEPEDGVVEPAPPAEGPAGGDQVGPFVVVLANGDRLTGTLQALGPGGLRLKPDVTAEAALEVPLTKVDAVDRSTAIEPLEARGDRIIPVAGGSISGEFAGMNAQGLTVDAHLVGRLQLPLESLAAFVREGREPPQRTAPARFCEVHVESGSLLVGHLSFEPTGLVVSAQGVSAKVAFEQIQAILFPADRPAAPAAAGATCLIELCNGTTLVSAAPEMAPGELRVPLGGGKPVAVPLDHVARIAFQSAGGPVAGRRRVVVWSKFADADEEANHVVTALREGLPKGWAVDVAADAADAAAIGKALGTAGALVVPEMENFQPRRAPDAKQFGKELRGFLAAGGTVVICSVDDTTQAFWQQAGLLSLDAVDRVEDDTEFEFARGHWLGAKVGDSFTATNGTYAYRTDDAELKPVAASDEAAAALVKRVGRGTVVLLGMDYFSRSKATDRVLVNSVTGGR